MMLFYAYSTADARHRDQFEKQLQALKARGALSTWDSRAVAPGGAWRREISPLVGKAETILLLMSADLLSSGYLDGPEVAAALKRHRDGEIRMVVALLRPVNIKTSVVAHLPVLPRDGKPVTRWNSPDAAFQAIAAGLVAPAAATSSSPSAPGASPRPAAPPPSVDAPAALGPSGLPALSAIALAPE